MKFLLLGSLLFSSLTFAQTPATEKLFKAITQNNLSLAQEAIREGADLNSYNRDKAPTTTVLVKAVKFNRLEIVKLLLENNADVNQRKPISLYTGLMVAAKRNLAPMTKLLMSYGADVNQYSVMMRTPLYIAAFYNSYDVAKVLLQSDEIKTNFSSLSGLCPLAVAARQDYKPLVTLLKNQTGAKAPTEKCLRKATRLAHEAGLTEVVNILEN